MNREWSLAELYSGFDDPKFQADADALDRLIGELTNAAADLTGDPADVLERILRLLESYEATLFNLVVYARLRQSADANDREAAAHIGRLLAKSSRTAGPQTAIRKYIAGLSDFDTIVASRPLLQEYGYLLRNIRADDRYVLEGAVEEAVSLYENSGSSAWSEMQNYLTASVPVSYRGETTNLSDIRNRAYDPNPAVRKEAYDAELSCYERIEGAVAYSLNSIKLEVLNRCRLRGYESPLQETLWSARMKPETLDALLGAMEEYLPRFRDYLKAKARLLGHENGLPWYDLFAPLGGIDHTYTAEEARDYLVSLFSGFDAELADMVRAAFDDAWIDFYPRSGKSGGAFCCSIYGIRQSRILTNFDGRFSDVVTLAHELGHAFHNRQLFDNRILNTDYSMPVAETASTFNEILVMKTAISRETDPTVRRALLESRLMDLTQIICDIYSRYLFEKAVFDSRDEEFLFPDRLCELMTDAQKTAYGDGLDPNAMHPYMWICKSHYYSGGLSFYNWPYAFGGLFAMGLYAKYRKEGAAFVPLYKKLLNATATCTVEDAAAIAGIDLTSRDFWRMSLQSASEEIDEFIRLCE